MLERIQNFVLKYNSDNTKRVYETTLGNSDNTIVQKVVQFVSLYWVEFGNNSQLIFDFKTIWL